jgi:glycosyltransferase involved in cell wall biosynthesis
MRLIHLGKKFGWRNSFAVLKDVLILIQFYIVDPDNIFHSRFISRLVTVTRFSEFQKELSKTFYLGFDSNNQRQMIFEKKVPLLRYLYLSSGHTPIGTFDFAYVRDCPESQVYTKSLLIHAIRHNRSYLITLGHENFKMKSAHKIQSNKWFLPKTIPSNLPQKIVFIVSGCQDFDLNFSQMNLHYPNLRIVVQRESHDKEFCSTNRNIFEKYFFENNSLNISLNLHTYSVVFLEGVVAILSQIDWLQVHDNSKCNTDLEVFLENNLEVLFQSTSRVQLAVPSNTTCKKSFTEFWEGGQIELPKFEINYIVKDFPAGHAQLPVLIVSHEDRRSGAPIFVGEMAKLLLKNEMKPKVVVIDDKDSESIYRELGIDFEYLSWRLKRDGKETQVHKSWLLTEDAKNALQSIILDFEPKLVILNSLASAGAAETLLKMNIPYIFYVHEIWGSRHSIINSLDPFLKTVEYGLTNARSVVYGSKAAMNVWTQQGSFRNEAALNTVLWEQGRKTDSTSLELGRENFGISDSTLVFLGIAVFEPRKRVEDIIEAFKIAQIPDSVLLLVGKSGRFPEYEGKIQRMVTGLNNVHLIAVTKDLNMFFEISDFFVHASEEEVFPLVIQQALGHSLPIILAKYNGYEELVGESYPYVFEPGDVNALVSLIKKSSDILETEKIYAKQIDLELKMTAEINQVTLLSYLRKYSTTVVSNERTFDK